MVNRLRWLIGGLLLPVVLTACAAGQGASPTPEQLTPTHTASPPPARQPTAPVPAQIATEVPSPVRPQRVILVSVEGGRDDWLAHYMAEGTMPTLADLAGRGAAGVLVGVDPPTATVAHNSLACGCLPAQTGIVAERVHRPQDTFYWYTSTLDLPMTPGRPIWMAAREAGLTTAALFWPGATPALPEQQADYTVGYGQRDAYSALHTLAFYVAQGWTDAPDSQSPPQEAQFQIGDYDQIIATVFVLALKTGDAPEVAYDTFILSSGDRAVDDGDAVLDAGRGEWAYWNFEPTGGRGADFLLVDPSLTSFTLYQSAVYHLSASPEGLQDALVERFGFFPPAPDYYALEQGWLTDDRYMEMVWRQSAWMMDVTLWVYQTYRPDLLFTVQSPLKQAGHQFLLVDERQPGYSDERAAGYARNLTQAASALDGALERLLATVAPEVEGGEVALFVTGSTGMAPIHTQVNLNTVLEQTGLLRLDGRNYVVVGQSQAIAFSSGGAAHVYINLEGAGADGIVAPDAYPDVQAQIVELLESLADPATGEPVLARVLQRDDLASVGLDGACAGDVFVQANPGYYLSDDRGPDAIFEPVVFYGHQGYPAVLPEMKGGLVVAGGGVLPGADLGEIRLVDLAPTLADLLGFDPGPGVDGQPLPALTER